MNTIENTILCSSSRACAGQYIYYTENEHGKKFRLAPLCQIKSHFLTIDNTVLREILINVRREASRQKRSSSLFSRDRKPSHCLDEHMLSTLLVPAGMLLWPSR
jgi:hypothetical protein